jgi:hypothetical protein
MLRETDRDSTEEFEIFQREISGLPAKTVKDVCLKYADKAVMLGEVGRARAFFTHACQFCDPLTEEVRFPADQYLFSRSFLSSHSPAAAGLLDGLGAVRAFAWQLRHLPGDASNEAQRSDGCRDYIESCTHRWTRSRSTTRTASPAACNPTCPATGGATACLGTMRGCYWRPGAFAMPAGHSHAPSPVKHPPACLQRDALISHPSGPGTDE